MEVKVSEARRLNGQGCELHKEQSISTLYWYSDTKESFTSIPPSLAVYRSVR